MPLGKVKIGMEQFVWKCNYQYKSKANEKELFIPGDTRIGNLSEAQWSCRYHFKSEMKSET